MQELTVGHFSLYTDSKMSYFLMNFYPIVSHV
jgi:hypothetical protein